MDSINSEQVWWEQEREELSAQAKDHFAVAADGLSALVQYFDVPLFSHDSGLYYSVNEYLDLELGNNQQFAMMSCHYLPRFSLPPLALLLWVRKMYLKRRYPVF